MSCIFCDIINKKSPADIVYEDEKFIVFKDVKPSAPVHLLILPKEHIVSINNLEKEHRELMGDLLLLAKKIAEKQGVSDGYRISFNVGRKGGQLIDHLHLHLMGGFK